MSIKKVGVIGCGVMGAGITQLCLQSGYSVIVQEVDQSFLDGGIERIKNGFDRMIKKGTISSKDKEDMLKRLSGAIDLGDVKDCDFVIEAVFEDIKLKMEIFKAADSLCKKEAIFLSNTSTLSITQMAISTSRRDRVIGLHFFNPAPVMLLVEVIKTIATNADVLQTVIDFAKSLGRVPIVAKDNAGFIVNLFLTPYLMDAIRGVSENIASIQDIDTAMKLGCNHPMGPLMLADFIGLDSLYKGASALFEEYRDRRYAPPPLLRKMVMMGELGQKSGRGFYDWTETTNPKPIDRSL